MLPDAGKIIYLLFAGTTLDAYLKCSGGNSCERSRASGLTENASNWRKTSARACCDKLAPCIASENVSAKIPCYAFVLTNTQRAAHD